MQKRWLALPIVLCMESDIMTTTIDSSKKKSRVLIVPNHYKDKEFKVSLKVAHWLRDKGQEVWFEQELEERVELTGFPFTDKSLLETIDYIFVLGGDGTIISTARKYYDYEIPMLGINLGNLGFLAEIELAELNETLNTFVAKRSLIDTRMMVGVMSDKGDYLGNALNDVVVSRQSISRMINFDVYVNDNFVNSYRADGVIISTPTGSTAYNLSAGGPIISPNSNTIVMTPICPHSLTARSIVLSGEDEVMITFKHPRNSHVNDLLVTIDGQETTRIYKEDTIIMKKSEKKVKLIRMSDHDFFDILRKKL